MGFSLGNFKIPDLSKYGNIGTKITSKIESLDVTSKLKSAVGNITGDFTSEITGTISEKMSGLTDGMELPNIDLSSLNTGEMDLSSQMQEFLNNMSINE